MKCCLSLESERSLREGGRRGELRSERSRKKKGAVMRVNAAESDALTCGVPAPNNRFAPLARNGKCISVDRAQTKGRTLARGLSPSRFLPFRAVLPSGSSPTHPAPCPALSRDISSANTRSRTVKGLTSQHDPLRASAPALVTSKVHDVIPWKRSTSKIAAWKWSNVFIRYPVPIQLKSP